MKMTSIFCQYFRTVRYMTFTQIYYRVRKYIIKPSAPALSYCVNYVAENFGDNLSFPSKKKSIISKDQFVFLNRHEELIFPNDWNNPNLPILWLYNLHYFDGVLNSETSDAASAFCSTWRVVSTSSALAALPRGEFPKGVPPGVEGLNSQFIGFPVKVTWPGAAAHCSLTWPGAAVVMLLAMLTKHSKKFE